MITVWHVVGNCVGLTSPIPKPNNRQLPGCISNRRQTVASNENLSAVDVANRIDACIRCNPGTTSVSLKTRSTTKEAILGAVHLDSGDFEAVRRCVDTLGL